MASLKLLPNPPGPPDLLESSRDRLGYFWDGFTKSAVMSGPSFERYLGRRLCPQERLGRPKEPEIKPCDILLLQEVAKDLGYPRSRVPGYGQDVPIFGPV